MNLLLLAILFSFFFPSHRSFPPPPPTPHSLSVVLVLKADVTIGWRYSRLLMLCMDQEMQPYCMIMIKFDRFDCELLSSLYRHGCLRLCVCVCVLMCESKCCSKLMLL